MSSKRKARDTQSSRLFLDTTVIRAATFGTTLQQDDIRSRLKGAKVASCLYVLTEIKNQVCMLIDVYFDMAASEDYRDAWRLAFESFSIREVKLAAVALTNTIQTGSKERALSGLANLIYGYIDNANLLIGNNWTTNQICCPLSK